jgi:hypothetical protein
MKTAVVASLVACVGLLLFSSTSRAAIAIIPASPLSTQSVVIRLTNQYGSEASVAAATITRSGNQFTISQVVDVVCALPTAPVLTSDFDVGVLPVGTYQVIAQIVHIGFGPGCNPAPITQNASFSVGEPASVPVGTFWTYLAIAALLGLSGASQMKRRHEP